MSIGPYILLLPDIALEKIFSFLTYDEIARNRLVCKRFNDAGGNLLSRGFTRIEKKHAALLKRMREKLPRRESKRRFHPMYRRCDVLIAMENRINLLNVTYMKYIQNKLCCFIPGKVLDELERILVVVVKAPTPPVTHELLLELRDISSLAVEHFEEKILPTIESKTANFVPCAALNSLANGNFPAVYFIQPELHEEMRKIKKQNDQITLLPQVIKKLYEKILIQNTTIQSQSILLQKHENKLLEQSTKLQKQESALNDLKKNIDKWDKKFSNYDIETIRSRETFHSKPTLKPSSNDKASNSRGTVRSKKNINKATLLSMPPTLETLSNDQAPNAIETIRSRKTMNKAVLHSIPTLKSSKVSNAIETMRYRETINKAVLPLMPALKLPSNVQVANAIETIRYRETMNKAMLLSMPALKLPSNDQAPNAIETFRSRKTTNKAMHSMPCLKLSSDVRAPGMDLMELENKRKSSLEYEIPQNLKKSKLRIVAKDESFQTLQSKDQINNKIDENISKNDAIDNNQKFVNKTGESSKFIISSLEALLKCPIGSIKSWGSNELLELNSLED